jgi:hypothetical protein
MVRVSSSVLLPSDVVMDMVIRTDALEPPGVTMFDSLAAKACPDHPQI